MNSSSLLTRLVLLAFGTLMLGLLGCDSAAPKDLHAEGQEAQEGEEALGEDGHNHEEMALRESALMNRPPLAGWERYEDANLRLRVDVPRGWTKKTALFEGPKGEEWELRISNYVDYPQTCHGDLVEISILGPREKPTDQTFYNFVHDPLFYSGDRFVEGGKWSGDLTALKVGGKEAFQVDNLGWERPCSGADYLVELDEKTFMLIEVSVGANASAQQQVQDILNTLVFQ